ncbi:DEAD/DEAH box helicase [Shewanella sp. NIFS-20-20]|uniref:DEAD/DEAH box helicase n=1 Tax=Shewanella sp. NIFS-20-20 TaxID=2853806 RepID=UPI001C463FBF|nr:DEAD/DEAH box helicase [Shewanella sp. NIFS-20-20]MBV7317558.1 DEAD/DEAH box helicase [Shewanella sp. NIFS-20-20]
MSFSQLPLAPILQQNLSHLGFIEATQIQAQAIPIILAGKDVLAGAQTGTGKTAAFGLPLIQQILSQALSPAPGNAPCILKALVLVPTRELALQVFTQLEALASHTGVRAGLAYGGVSIDGQIRALAQGIDVLVATPGRLIDLLKKRRLNLKQLAMLVFDEADRMLDMGFMDEIREILKHLSKTRQTLLFSATLNDNIFKLSKRLQHQAQVIEVHGRNTTAVSVTEQVYQVDTERKLDLLSHLLRRHAWSRVLIFSRQRQDVAKLSQDLLQQGFNVAPLHGDLSQHVREQTLSSFKRHEINVIVATDIAARGIDIDDLPVVINMELPFKTEDYVHRIGRTGRAGQQGLAISLLDHQDEKLLHNLETFLGRRLPSQWYLGFEPDLTKHHDMPKSLSKAAQKQAARKKALAQSKQRSS